MKNHYRIFSVLLVALLLLGSLAACTDTSDPASDAASVTESTPDASEDAGSVEESMDESMGEVSAESTLEGDPTSEGTTPSSGAASSTTAGGNNKPGSTAKKPTASTTAASKPTTVKITTTQKKITYPTLPSGFTYKTDAKDNAKDMKFPAATSENFTQAATKTPSAAAQTGSIYNALDFGVTPDDLAADSTALQHAMNQVSSLGGTLYIPKGIYIIDKPLTIPQRMTVSGDFDEVTDTDCTTFLVYCGHGDADGTPLITMSGYATFTGIRIYYPKQSKASPVAYPATFTNSGDSYTIEDVFIVNPYFAMKFHNGSGRHWLTNIYGQPLYRGVEIDHCLDVGRMEGIVFAPYWSQHATEYTLNNLIAFTWGKTDWEFVGELRAEYAAVGYKFTTLGNGNTGNVQLDSVSAYRCKDAVYVDAVQEHAGVVFNKSVFDGRINISYMEIGPVKFDGCTFTANSYNETVLNLQGVGPIFVTGCTIDTSNAKNASAPAMYANADRMIVTGNHFTGKCTTDIRIGVEVKAGVFTGNSATGHTLKITDESTGNVAY